MQGGPQPFLLVIRDLGSAGRAVLAFDGKALMAQVGQPLLARAGLGSEARVEPFDPETGAGRLLVPPEQLPTEWGFAAVA